LTALRVTQHRPLADQQGQEFLSAISTTRAGDAPLSADASLQKFVAVHSSIHNHFNHERYLYSWTNFKLNRAAALAE
jgi:uncharacterized protein YbgA (DUF1722 family)